MFKKIASAVVVPQKRSIKRMVWYKIALFAPIIFSAIFLVGFKFFGAVSGSILFFCVLLGGGLQYLVFACGVLWWARNKTATQLHEARILLPFLFAPVCAAGAIVAGIIFPELFGRHTSVLAAGVGLGAAAVPFGYFFVGLVGLLTKLLEGVGLIKD